MNPNAGLLDVNPSMLIESPSVSTFLPDEDASICPLLHSNNTGSTTPMMTFSHPLNANGLDGDNQSQHSAGGGVLGGATECKGDNSSTGSSSGIGGLEMVADSAATSLFNKHSAYQHLHMQNNNLPAQDNGHVPNGNGLAKEAPPAFVSWNWPLIRKCTFFVFISSLLAMCAVVVAMIVMLPRTCNPEVAWYRGSVFYEIFPASFRDSNNDGVGDLRGIGNRIDYLVDLGVAAVRLNSIYPSPHYPEDYEAVQTLTEVAEVLGDKRDVAQLAESLHARNISLILDLSVQGFWSELLDDAHTAALQANPEDSSLEAAAQLNSSMLAAEPLLPTPQPLRDNLINAAMRQWLSLGVDGFYVKGLEHVPSSENIQLSKHLATWKRLLGAERVLIVSEAGFNALSAEERLAAMPHIDLVDVALDVRHGTKRMEERLKAVLDGQLAPNNDGVWLHWSIGGVDRTRLAAQQSSNFTLAATLMQLMLPGTPSVFYGDEIALSGSLLDATTSADSGDEHNDTRHLQHLTAMPWTEEVHSTTKLTLPWLPQHIAYRFDYRETIASMIKLRQRNPAIYKNAVCKMEVNQPNTEIKRSHDDIIIVERIYPRRFSFVAVSNYGQKRVGMDMSSMFYGGNEMLQPEEEGKSATKVYFNRFEIGPMQTVVVKLDK